MRSGKQWHDTYGDVTEEVAFPLNISGGDRSAARKSGLYANCSQAVELERESKHEPTAYEDFQTLFRNHCASSDATSNGPMFLAADQPLDEDCPFSCSANSFTYVTEHQMWSPRK